MNCYKNAKFVSPWLHSLITGIWRHCLAYYIICLSVICIEAISTFIMERITKLHKLHVINNNRHPLKGGITVTARYHQFPQFFRITLINVHRNWPHKDASLSLNMCVVSSKETVFRPLIVICVTVRSLHLVLLLMPPLKASHRKRVVYLSGFPGRRKVPGQYSVVVFTENAQTLFFPFSNINIKNRQFGQMSRGFNAKLIVIHSGLRRQ